jgi:WD40 repeat protein
MVDVFISYSRKDVDFVRRLHQSLSQEKRDTWVDWEDIPASADWWREVTGGIEAADSFMFIISPDSVRSEVCRKEIDHAVANNKRMVPILYKPTTEPADQSLMHPSIGSHNWIFFRDTDNFNTAFNALLKALDTDLSHVRQHTRLLVRAKEWENSNENPSFLIRGDDLNQAEDWLATGVAKQPAPTSLHAEYINSSRDAAIRRQRALLGGVTVALVVALGLAFLSFLLFGEADYQRGIAEEKSITATVAQGEAQLQADIAQTQAAIALDNAATAVVAQADAQNQAIIARTQAAIALENAALATVAQGEAQIQAEIAVTQAARAENNAALATIAQGEAQIQADIAQTQAAIALDNAATAIVAQADAQQRATAVAQERNRAQSIAYAGQSQVELANDQSRSVLISLYALQNYPYTWQAERALGIAVQAQLPRFQLLSAAAFTSVDWSPDGTRLVTVDNTGSLLVVNGADGVVLRTIDAHPEGINRALWSPDGTRIASASNDDTARIWDAESGSLLSTLSGHEAGVNGLDWSPDGTKLITASNDGTARVWDAQAGTILWVLNGHVRSVNGVEWSADGARVLTAGDDGTARVWDAQTGTEQFTLSGHTGSVNRALWSPDGHRILTVSSDSTAKVWDGSTGAEIFTLVGHVRSITRAAWSPGGNQIVTISEDDTANIWNATTGVLRIVLYGHTDDVSGVAWSPDGARLVTVGEDAITRVWNASSGAQLLVFTAHRNEIYSVAWSPDGTRIATASADNSTRIWGIWKDSSDLVSIAQNCCVTRVLTDEESAQFGIPPAPSAPPPEMIKSCTGSLPSRLYPGTRAQVTADGDDRALNVRNQPGLSGQQVGQISPNKTFWVIGDSECADGLVWFPVIYGINAASGWIAEGEGDVYFVRPLP